MINNKLPNVPRKHHYVQQSYMAKWYNDNLKFSVLYLNSNRIWQKTTNEICFEEYFYKISRLTKDEIDFLLYKLFKNVPDVLKNRMIEIINLPFCDISIESSNEEIAKKVARIFHENRSEIETPVFIKSGELFIGDIEKSLDKKIWNRIFSKDKTVFTDGQSRVDVFSYICAQRWRVPKMKLILTEKISFANKVLYNGLADLSIDRLFPYFVIFQSMVEATLLANCNCNASYLSISNKSNISFVTSDNPVINVCLDFDSNNNPKRLELFWPVSPKLAVLISKKDVSRELSEDEVINYNSLIKKEAFKYVISYDDYNLNMLKCNCN